MGVTDRQLVQIGDDYLQQQQYAEALHWYNRTLSPEESVPDYLSFRYAVTRQLAGPGDAAAGEATLQMLAPDAEIYRLEQELTLPGAALRWLNHFPNTDITSGTPLSFSAPSPELGVFWWNGEALALIDAAATAEYRIDVHLQHSIPPPIEVAIRINGQTVSSASLARGDDSWETISQTIQLNHGLNIVHLAFLNDATVAGQDRNALLQWIKIVRI
jgi:hypothetical protein